MINQIQNVDSIALKLVDILFQKGLIDMDAYQRILSKYSA